MSRRQPVSSIRKPSAATKGLGTIADVARMSACATLSGVLFLNFGHLFGVELFEERFGLAHFEFRIRGLDTQEKSVDGCAFGKAFHIEHRMIGLRQFVEGQHSDDGAESGQENSALKGD